MTDLRGEKLIALDLHRMRVRHPILRPSAGTPEKTDALPVLRARGLEAERVARSERHLDVDWRRRAVDGRLRLRLRRQRSADRERADGSDSRGRVGAGRTGRRRRLARAKEGERKASPAALDEGRREPHRTTLRDGGGHRCSCWGGWRRGDQRGRDDLVVPREEGPEDERGHRGRELGGDARVDLRWRSRDGMVNDGSNAATQGDKGRDVPS